MCDTSAPSDEHCGAQRVSPEEYVALVTSFRRIVRVNRVPAPVHRLADIETGKTYWIPEEELPLD